MTAVSDFQKYCFGVLLVLMYSNALACVPERSADCQSYKCCKTNQESKGSSAKISVKKVKTHHLTSSHVEKTHFPKKFNLNKSESGFSGFQWQSFHQNLVCRQSQKLYRKEFREVFISKIKNTPKNKDALEERSV